MNVHEEIEEWMAAAVTDGLSLDERKVFEEHLSSCSHCQSLFQEEQMLSNQLANTLASDSPGPDFEKRIIARFRRAKATSPESFFKRCCRTLIALRWQFSLISTVALVIVLVRLGIHLDDSFSKKNMLSTEPLILPFQSASADLDTSLRKPKSEFSGQKKPLQERIDELESKLRNSNTGKAAGIGMKLNGYTDTSYIDFNAVQTTGSEEFKPSALFEKTAAASNEVDLQNPTAKDQILHSERPKQSGQGFLDICATPAEIVEQNGTEAAPVDPRKLIRNATLELEVPNFETALHQITQIVAEERGFVATTRSSRQSNGKIRGDIVLKVLPNHLDRLLLGLRKLGELKNQSLKTEDVTKTYIDTEARLRNSRRMETRLSEMLEKEGGKIMDLLVVEKELARVREQIEQLQGELKFYDSQVRHATVTISLNETDMDRAGQYLLKESANLAIYSQDVEETFRKARIFVEKMQAQILQSHLDRDASGQISALLILLAKPEDSDIILAQFKTIGRVRTLTWSNERIPQGGEARSQSAAVQKDNVQIQLKIVHDDESQRKIQLRVLSKNVENGMEKAKAEALTHKAEIVSSSLRTTPEGQTTGSLIVRATAGATPQILVSFKALGRVSEYAVEQEDTPAQINERQDSPVLISLNLTDQAAPLQNTRMNLFTQNVDLQLGRLKQIGEKMGAKILDSKFEHQPDGKEVAQLSLRVPMDKNSLLMEEVRKIGKVRDLSIQRDDSMNKQSGSPDACADICTQLYSQEDLIGGESGLWATFRTTLAQGIGELLWSLRMIGVSLAFLAPWLLLSGLLGWAGWRWHRRRKR